MHPNQGTFNAKLYEMDRQYALLHSRLQVCQQQEDRKKVERGIELLQNECEVNSLLLEGNVRGSRSPFVAELAEAQLTYKRQVEKDVKAFLAQKGSPEECAEAITLYAEFAIDFATQAMNEALLVAMHAVNAQLKAGETAKEEAT